MFSRRGLALRLALGEVGLMLENEHETETWHMRALHGHDGLFGSPLEYAPRHAVMLVSFSSLIYSLGMGYGVRLSSVFWEFGGLRFWG